jgi:hypothetical protein
MLSDLFKKSPSKPQEVEVLAVYEEPKPTVFVDAHYQILLALVSRVSGVSIESLQPLTQEELLQFITLGYWPNEQQQLISIRKNSNARQTKKD